MKRLILVVALIGVCIVGLGFYLGWFQIGSDTSQGKSNLTLSVDKYKFDEDRKKAIANVQEVGNQIKNKVAGPAETSMDGTVVSAGDEKLMMADKEGKEHGHALAAKVHVTRDGKLCTVADLKAGMRIRVTTESAEPHAATRIEALENNKDFDAGG